MTDRSPIRSSRLTPPPTNSYSHRLDPKMALATTLFPLTGLLAGAFVVVVAAPDGDAATGPGVTL